ncbi:hypothetical protein CA603_32690 [Paraburkholderia hospita]|nr:hypothetical protein CA603_32690 [Paraburkholderia hospita]
MQRELHEFTYLDDCFEEDWDGEGANPLSDAAVERAKEFIVRLPIDYPVGSAMAGVDGSLGVIWENDTAQVYLDFRADGRVRYYMRKGREYRVESVCSAEVPIDDLLGKVSAALDWVFPMQGAVVQVESSATFSIRTLFLNVTTSESLYRNVGNAGLSSWGIPSFNHTATNYLPLAA